MRFLTPIKKVMRIYSIFSQDPNIYIYITLVCNNFVFVAIVTRLDDIGTKQNGIHNLLSASYRQFRFHKNFLVLLELSQDQDRHTGIQTDLLSGWNGIRGHYTRVLLSRNEPNLIVGTDRRTDSGQTESKPIVPFCFTGRGFKKKVK